jgi:glycosyltransferase involved in cell wall biosynthesis
MSVKTISVGLCTFNGGLYRHEQIDSILWQSELPEEIVACDDRSCDETTRILNDYAKRSLIPFHVHNNPNNLGSTLNFAKSLSLCNGTIIVLADQDDRWHPDKLDHFRRLFHSTPDIDLVFTNADLMDYFGEQLSERLWESVGFTSVLQRHAARHGMLDVLLRQYVVTVATMAFRSSWKDRVLPIPAG